MILLNADVLNCSGAMWCVASRILAAAIPSIQTTPRATHPLLNPRAMHPFVTQKVFLGHELRPVRSERLLQHPRIRRRSVMTGQQDVVMPPLDPRYFFQ